MQTTTANCIITQHLSKLETSLSKDELTLFFQNLTHSITSLIDHPSDQKSKIIKKDNKEFPSKALSNQEAVNFLEFLGFSEENDRFVYIPCDENSSKLEHTQSIIESLLKKQAEAFVDEEETDGAKIRVNSQDRPPLREIKRPSCNRLKEHFLSKHLKKESDDGLMNVIKNEKRQASKPSDFAFNTNGYFYQSCSNRDAKRKRGVMGEFFHQQDHTTRGLSSSSSNMRLI